MHVKNDAGERGVKTVKDGVPHYRREEQLQRSLVTVVEERKRAKANKSGSISKSALQNIVVVDNNND
jgi:hypothetical protein